MYMAHVGAGLLLPLCPVDIMLPTTELFAFVSQINLFVSSFLFLIYCERRRYGAGCLEHLLHTRY